MSGTIDPVRSLRLLVGWLLTAALAAGVGLATVVLVRQGVGGDNTPVSTLSHDQIQAQLAAAGPAPSTTPGPTGPTSRPSTVASASRTPGSLTTTARPTPAQSSARPTDQPSSATPAPSTASPSASTTVGVVSSPGGSVVARCTYDGSGGVVYLLSWSPAQGYSTHEVHRGPAQEAEITFESATGEVVMHVTCGPSGPVGHAESEDDGLTHH